MPTAPSRAAAPANRQRIRSLSSPSVLEAEKGAPLAAALWAALFLAGVLVGAVLRGGAW